MIPYIAVLLWALFISTSLRSLHSQSMKPIGRSLKSNASLAVLSTLASAPLILLHALRKDVGTDYSSYVRIYDSFIDGISVWSYEPLYSIINIAATPFGASGIAIVFGISAALSTIPVIWRIFHSSDFPSLSLIALFGMTYPFLQTNAVRSVIAISILFLVLPAIWHGRPWRWFLAGIIAAGFHYSAFFVLPFYWILRRNINITTSIVAFIGAILLATYKPIGLTFLNFSLLILPKTYSNYATQAIENFNEVIIGPGFAWYIINVFFVLLFWNRVGFLGVRERVIRNTFFIGLIIIIAVYQFIYIGRIGWFFYIAGVLYWPVIVSQIFPRYKILISLGLIICFSFLFYFTSYIGAHDAVPYQWIVT